MTIVQSVRIAGFSALIAGHASAEPRLPEASTSAASSRAGDRYALSARSETVIQLFRRALLPGANGVLVGTDTALPIHEALSVQARDVDAPWHRDSLDFDFSAWGRVEAAPNDSEAPFDGDVQTANVRYGSPSLWLRAGRQHAAGGAARFVRFDGVTLGADAGLGPFVVAYGGYAALPRWDRRPRYRHLGAVEGAMSSYAEQELERGQHLLFGGQAGYRARSARGALSFHEQRQDGGTERSDVGLDFDVAWSELVSTGGSAILELDSHRLATLRLWADVSPSRSLALGVELHRADPALLLSRMSVLSVFGGAGYDEAGVTASLRACSFLSFESSGLVQRYSDGRDGARGEVAARLVSGGTRRTTGKGGYEYPQKSYGSSSHSNLESGCVDCHMPPNDDLGGIGDHSFYAQLSACVDCHQTATNFDVIGGQSKVREWLRRLRVSLNDLSLLSRDGTTPLSAEVLEDEDFVHDGALPKMGVPADAAGALYNYFLVARGSASGVHNPRYVGQLLYDSIEAVDGNLSGVVRPP